MAESNIPSYVSKADQGFCYICKESLTHADNITTPCRHVLHKSCLTVWLVDKGSCPVCNHPLDKNLLFHTTLMETSFDEEGIGFSNRGPHTRSKGAVPKQQSVTYKTALSPRKRRRNPSFGNTGNRKKQACPNNHMNYKELEEMIDASVQRSNKTNVQMLKSTVGDIVEKSLEAYMTRLSLNSIPNNAHMTRDSTDVLWPSDMPSFSNQFSNIPPPSFAPRQSNNVSENYAQHRTSNVSFEKNKELNEKKIINWKLTFDGSFDKIPVEEFIYRVTALTKSSLHGDFDTLCENAHLLFEGRAKNWFWQYHKSVRSITWIELCENLKRNFRDVRTDVYIKGKITARKQKVGEPFESYFNSIVSLFDLLKVRPDEQEIIETIKRNLRNDLQIALLHFNFSSVAELREACNKHELFLENYSTVQSGSKYTIPNRKQIAEIDSETMVEENCEINRPKSENPKCWNCEHSGHSYKSCTKPQRVFCYKCGLVGFYSANCIKCNSPENPQRGTFQEQRRYPNAQN